ncbi:MAG: aa3-type cytochrome c oxidase subunit IV [Acidimicrobiales bacterium]|nr:aa3-type cytochrome c oxidase subunit IV [Hyphomonadaceae bacterium]RZV41527.1 MAG: aa3-type cytochrome c oxidase subunit IV [Acidimicrobiales bacterium]
MAAGHSDYSRGDMPVDAHNKTFSGFIKGSAFGTAFIAVSVIMPTLVFCTSMTWGPALLISFIIGLILGPVLKLGGSWYGTLIALAIFAALVSMLISAIA